MKRRSVVVSTMGNFGNYEEVTYSLADFSGYREARTRFSSAALAKMSGAELMLVFAPISLVSKYIYSSEGGNLKEISEVIKSNAQEFLIKESGNGINIKLVVTPIKGTFSIEPPGKGTIEIRSGSGNFYVAVYKAATEIFKEYSSCEVLVDITHSVNYMGLDMVDATNLALRALNGSYSTKHDFSFRVYNSDPFVKDIPSRLQLNLIRTEPIHERSHSLSKIVGDLLYNLDINYCKRALKKANLDGDVKMDILKKLAYSFLLGAVLFVGSYKSDIKKWAGEVWNSMEDAQIAFTTSQKPALLNGVLDLGIELERELPKIHAFLSSISSAEFSALDNCTEIEKLKVVSELLVEPGKTLLKNELDALRRDITGLPDEERAEKVLLRTILKHKYPEGKSNMEKECTLDKRNFIAHAGLEANVTWVSFRGNEVFLSYDKCLDSVAKAISTKN